MCVGVSLVTLDLLHLPFLHLGTPSNHVLVSVKVTVTMVYSRRVPSSMIEEKSSPRKLTIKMMAEGEESEEQTDGSRYKNQILQEDASD